MNKSLAKWIALAVFLFVAIGVPLIERWWKCMAPQSEACVWAKALWPVSLGVGCVLGLVVAVVVWLALGAWAKPAGPLQASSSEDESRDTSATEKRSEK